MHISSLIVNISTSTPDSTTSVQAQRDALHGEIEDAKRREADAAARHAREVAQQHQAGMALEKKKKGGGGC